MNTTKWLIATMGLVIGVSIWFQKAEKPGSHIIENPDKVLYLLESNVPFRFAIDYVLNGPPDNFYLTRLHTIDFDSLMVVDTLNYKPNKGIVGWVDWIKHYPGEKLIFMLERLEHSGYYRKSVLNYNNGIEVNQFYFKRARYSLSGLSSKLLKSRKSGEVLNNFIFDSENDSRSIYMDLDFNPKEDINFEEYYLIYEGRAGTALNEYSGIRSPLDVSGGNCDVLINYGRSNDPLYMFSFPCNLEETRSNIFFHLINDQYFVFHGSPNFDYFAPFNDTANIGATLNLYDYQNGFVDTFHVKGGMATGLSYFYRDWIFGTAGYLRPPKSDENHYHRDFYPPSPGERVYNYDLFGLDSRYFDHGKYGIPFEWREYDRRFYFPGELYTLHLPTMKQTYWETGQGDSEILLLNDEEVIYREHHKIFRAPIVDYQPMIEERELLVMDSLVVPHIHWAFYAEEGTINKSEINKDGFEEYMEER